jgi:hypothetical protein
MVSPTIYRLSLDSKPLAAGALSQAHDDIGPVPFDGADELAAVKPYRKDDFLEAVSLWKLPENFLSDVLGELPVRAKAVDQ